MQRNASFIGYGLLAFLVLVMIVVPLLLYYRPFEPKPVAATPTVRVIHTVVIVTQTPRIYIERPTVEPEATPVQRG